MVVRRDIRGCQDIGLTLPSSYDSVEWLLKHKNKTEAIDAVGRMVSLRGLDFQVKTYFTQGPRLLLTRHTGPVALAALAEAIHDDKPNARFTLFNEIVAGIQGEKVYVLFDASSTFRAFSLRFGRSRFTVAFRVAQLYSRYHFSYTDLPCRSETITHHPLDSGRADVW